MTPAPTPVSAMTTAMQNPMRKSISTRFPIAYYDGLQMNAALLLLAAPTSGAGIVGSRGRLVQGSQPMLE